MWVSFLFTQSENRILVSILFGRSVGRDLWKDGSGEESL